MILDFEKSATETNSLWLIFPQNDDAQYFVPEEKISAFRETEEDVVIYLTSKTSNVEQFRLEGTRLDDIKNAINFDDYIAITNQDDQSMLIAPRGINSVRRVEGEPPLFDIRVASQDCIWGEGFGSLSFIAKETTPQIQDYLDTLPKDRDNHGWTVPLIT